MLCNETLIKKIDPNDFICSEYVVCKLQQELIVLLCVANCYYIVCSIIIISVTISKEIR